MLRENQIRTAEVRRPTGLNRFRPETPRRELLETRWVGSSLGRVDGFLVAHRVSFPEALGG